MPKNKETILVKKLKKKVLPIAKRIMFCFILSDKFNRTTFLVGNRNKQNITQ